MTTDNQNQKIVIRDIRYTSYGEDAEWTKVAIIDWQPKRRARVRSLVVECEEVGE